MKKIYIISFLLILSASNILSQSGWFWQNPLPQGNDLNSIKFIDGNTGYAVGIKGTIIKTTDGGNNWYLQNSKTTEILYNVLFVNESIGIVVGERGTVLRTSNGGLNWESVVTINNTKFNGIYFQNQLTGWVCGYDNNNGGYGMIYKTTDSGMSWNINYNTLGSGFYKIHFLNNNTGFADNGVYFYRTTNAGSNWSWIGTLSYSLDFDFINSQNIIFAGGYILGSTLHGTIRKSTNGGSNIITVIDLVDTLLQSVDFINENTGVIVGQKGKILKTTNIGINWTRILSPAYSNLKSIYFKDSINGMVSGDFGTLYATSNSGDNWSLKTEGIINSNLSSAVFVNSNTGIAVGQNYILKTTNNGIMWALKFNDPSLFWNKVQMLDENIGFASSNNRNLYKTTNGGENWFFISTFGSGLITINYAYSFQFVNTLTGYASGYQYNAPPGPNIKSFFKTIDGGLNWSRVYSGGVGTLYDQHFINDNTGMLVGYNNVLKTVNGGLNWNVCVNTSATYNKVYYLDDSNIWVIGSESIIKSDNGGFNWQTQYIQTGESFSSIKFINQNTGWVTSKKGNLFATSNGGNNWLYQNTPNQYGLNDVYFISSGTGWVFGDKGIILKTISGVMPNALDPLSSLIPKQFSLYQNYPNPFNPVTKIKFDIPANVGNGRDRSVKVIIYDLLGREVATLVNEQLSPGSYSVDWDGSAFASGVYFYSLIVDDPSTGSGRGYVETKRMVLIK